MGASSVLPIQGLGEGRSGPWRGSDRTRLQLGVGRRLNFSQGVVQGCSCFNHRRILKIGSGGPLGPCRAAPKGQRLRDQATLSACSALHA
eukprot:3656095-Alexandrium_andersonii.AAC.1